MAWHIGQKVVCIKRGKWAHGYGTEIDPVFGQVLTIRTRHVDPNGFLVLRFEEIHNEPGRYFSGVMEVAYAAFRFRRVASKPTDISIFTSMLAPSPKKARQRA